MLFVFEALAMRRQDYNALISGCKENVSSLRSCSQKSDKMDSQETDTDELVSSGAFGINLPQLNDRLNTIFTDVASKLPSIDFDTSDVSYID